MSPNHLFKSSSTHKKAKQVKTLSNHNRCFKDKTASEIFYQLAATFNKSLFTGLHLFWSPLKVYDLLFQPTFVLFYIPNPLILIKFDFESNQISFM